MDKVESHQIRSSVIPTPKLPCAKLLFRTVLGRLTVLSLFVALIGGAVWSWETWPIYVLRYQCFYTMSPDLTSLARDGKPFDVNNAYHRSMLVGGPMLRPYGVDWETNTFLGERRYATDDAVAKMHSREYSTHCGFVDDPVQFTRVIYEDSYLCNGGKLTEAALKAAIEVFREKYDQERHSYRTYVVRNVAEKFSKCLVIFAAFIAICVAAMWVFKGRPV